MRHMSSYISSKHLIDYISPFSIASYKTWSFFDPHKVLQFHINHKYSCSSSYMIWISDIFLHYISCCIFSWSNCPCNWHNHLGKSCSVQSKSQVLNQCRLAGAPVFFRERESYLISTGSIQIQNGKM